MKNVLIALVLTLAASFSTAQADSACESKALDKHLAGAAKTSFMKKCDREAKAADAAVTCASQAADKKLNGAAKASFTKKCIKDASK